MTVIPFPSPKDFAPPAIATDAMADLIFSLILDREAELVALAEAEGRCGISGAKRVGAGRCSRAPSANPFTKRSNAALASAMIWRDPRGGIGGSHEQINRRA